MNRFQASLTHLALSILVATVIFVPIYFVWFPDTLFEGAGGRELFFLITSVDVVLGPLVTLVVFKSRKRGLKFDLAVIGILQAAALAYGVSVLFESRPVFIVFVKDRFELVRASQVSRENLAKARSSQFASTPLTGPKVVGARVPKDVGESFDLMMSALGGVDVQSFPRYYVPYVEIRADALARAESMEKLRKHNPEGGARIDQLVASTGRPEGALRYLPMRAGKRDLSVVLDSRTGDVLRFAALKPWEY